MSEQEVPYRERPIVYKKNLNLRVRPEQMKHWNKAAEAADLDLSEWVRQALDKEAKRG